MSKVIYLDEQGNPLINKTTGSAGAKGPTYLDESGNPKPAPAKIPQTATEAARGMLPSKPEDFIPYVSGAAGVMTGMATANPVLGSATMAASDYFLRKWYGQDPKSLSSGIVGESPYPGVDAVTKIGEDTVMAEAGGKVLSKAGGAISNAVKEASDTTMLGRLRNFFGIDGGAGTVVKDRVAAFEPTYSGYSDAKGSSMAKFVENAAAADSKSLSVANSNSLIYDKSAGIYQDLTGKSLIFNPDRDARILQAKTQMNYSAALQASKASSENLNLIANSKPNAVVLTSQAPPTTIPPKPTGILDPFGQMTMTPQQIVPGKITKTIVNGPISMDATAAKLLELKDKISQSLAKPDPNNPLFRSIDSALDSLGYSVDDTTKTVSFGKKVVPFNLAWSTKQAIGQEAFDKASNLPSAMRKGYRELYNVIDTDIENGINNWAANPQEAQKSWQNTKQIVNRTYDLFNPPNETGLSSDTLLSTKNEPNPAIDAIMTDSKKLQRFLDQGSMSIGAWPTKQIITSLSKVKDMRGYAFTSIWQNAWKPLEASELSSGVTNAAKLNEAWADYSNSDAGKLLYNKQQRADISQFFKDASQVATRPPNPSVYLTLRAGSAIASVSTAFTGAMLTGGSLKGAAYGLPIASITIGAHVVGKLLTNPETARLMIAMQRGGPLSMSTAMAGRMISKALTGEAVQGIMGNGTQVDGKIVNGAFKPNEIGQ